MFSQLYKDHENNLFVTFSWQLVEDSYIRAGTFQLGRIDACPRNVELRRAGAAARDTCTRDQLCRILGGLNQAFHVCIQPSWVILSFFIPRAVVASHCSGSPLDSVTQTKCRVGAEGESNRARQRRPLRGKRWWRNESRRERVLLIFSNIWSDEDERGRERERMGERSLKKSSEK